MTVVQPRATGGITMKNTAPLPLQIWKGRDQSRLKEYRLWRSRTLRRRLPVSLSQNHIAGLLNKMTTTRRSPRNGTTIPLGCSYGGVLYHGCKIRMHRQRRSQLLPIRSMVFNTRPKQDKIYGHVGGCANKPQ